MGELIYLFSKRKKCTVDQRENHTRGGNGSPSLSNNIGYNNIAASIGTAPPLLVQRRLYWYVPPLLVQSRLYWYRAASIGTEPPLLVPCLLYWYRGVTVLLPGWVIWK
jgi:hypothetical protein